MTLLYFKCLEPIEAVGGTYESLKQRLLEKLTQDSAEYMVQ